MPVYLDEQGNPVGAPTKTYLDEQGNPILPPNQGAVEGSSVSRFLGAAAENLIPEAIRHPSMLAQVPGALRDVVARQVQEGDPTALALPGLRPTLQAAAEGIAGSSAASYRHQRDQGTNIVSSALAAIPIIGPPAAQAGEEIGQGNYAEGFGHAAGMLAPFALRPAANLTKAAGTAAIETGGKLYQAYPKTSNMVIGALPGVFTGNPTLAVSGALAGAKYGGIVQALKTVLKDAAPEASTEAGWTASKQAQAMRVAGAHERALKMDAKMAPEASRIAPGATEAARAMEGAGLSPELATAEAAKAAQTTGEVSGSLPGVFTPPKGTPAVKIPDLVAAQKIEAQVQTLRANGLSKPQIAQTLRETYGHLNMTQAEAENVVSMVAEARGPAAAATTSAVPAGSKVMPPYRGGKAQPYTGPARVPKDSADLEDLLRQSLKAYEIP